MQTFTADIAKVFTTVDWKVLGILYVGETPVQWIETELRDHLGQAGGYQLKPNERALRHVNLTDICESTSELTTVFTLRFFLPEAVCSCKRSRSNWRVYISDSL